MKILGFSTIIVVVYTPIEGSEKRIKDKFYEDLYDVISNINQKDDIILAVDMNGRVKSQIQSEVVGGLPKRRRMVMAKG